MNPLSGERHRVRGDGDRLDLDEPVRADQGPDAHERAGRRTLPGDVSGPHLAGQGHQFVAFQASARGGVVKVRVVRDRALLGGRAVTVSRGELLG